MGNMAPQHIETVNGQVAHTINNHQHSHTHHHRHNHTVHAYGPVHVHNHAEAPAFALQAPPAPPARVRQRGQSSADITPAQKALLGLMRPLPKQVRVGVLDFMRIEFGTGMVADLSPSELQRVRRVVLDARHTAGL